MPLLDHLHDPMKRKSPWTALHSDEVYIYASAYRPVQRQDRTELDIWAETCQVGAALPTMPLRLTGDLIVPVEFEATYTEFCQRRHLI